MNRTWITALTVATVAGSGAAFAGVVANTNDTPAAAQPLPAINPQSALMQVQTKPGVTTPTRTLNYQVGNAGVATLTIANGALTVDNAVVSTGWTMTSASAPGTHVDVQFTDGTQVVTFGADLVGNDVVVVSITNVAAEVPVTTAPATTAPAQPSPIAVTHTTFPAATSPRPAAPAPTVAPAPAVQQPPAAAATTAPSGSGDDAHEEDSNDD
jgi:hypothetical protein